MRFDLIFVDGLHTAEQAWRDIENALKFLSPDGFVVMHDCNPPTEWHAREDYECLLTPAQYDWNGSTWKAFLKARSILGIQSCCVDTDWGVGILCKHLPLGHPTLESNPFYEFKVLDDHRTQLLNLVTFDELQARVKGKPALHSQADGA